MKTLVSLGALVELEVADGKGNDLMVLRPHNAMLAWDGRRFHICRVTGATKKNLPSSVVSKHKTFHRAPPKGALLGDSPAAQGPLRQVGLLKALTYRVPARIDSPSKKRHLWHHDFGDTGHRGGKYPTRVMPALMKDARGNLFIKRRKGNIFSVDEWLRG